MNILVIGKFYTEGFALHIAETLVGMGHSVCRFEPGFRSGRVSGHLGRRVDQVRGVIHSAIDSLPIVRGRQMRELWQVAEHGPLSAVIVCHDFLWPEEVAELKRRTNAAVVMWFPDHLANFGKGFFMNASYDGLFFKDPYIVQMLKDVLHSPVFYLPECFSPVRHTLPLDDISCPPAYVCDITTAGNLHSWRVAVFRHLVEHDIKIWGNPAPLWLDLGAMKRMYQGRGVYNHDKVRAFRASKIVLNSLHFGEIWGVNVRTFEVAAACAFQVVDYRPGIEGLFRVGEEIVTFSGIADLKDKIKYWLPRHEERNKIARAGYVRVHRDHTYSQRLDLMIQTLGGNAHGYPMPAIMEARCS